MATYNLLTTGPDFLLLAATEPSLSGYIITTSTLLTRLVYARATSLRRAKKIVRRILASLGPLSAPVVIWLPRTNTNPRLMYSVSGMRISGAA